MSYNVHAQNSWSSSVFRSGLPAERLGSLRVLCFRDHQRSFYSLYSVGWINNIQFLFFFFSVVPLGMQDLSSPSRDQTHPPPCSESTES